MTGPHPAVAAVRRAVRECLVAGEPVFVACSGGADSLALAAALAFEAPRAGCPGGLITVDHGLQAGSEVQARHVAAVGWELGLDPVHLVRVDVDPAFPGGPEAAARAARYAVMDAIADSCPERATVLLGHTLDDQAETVLLGLGRGSGPRSVAGMRARADHYRRPLLGIRRETTRAACTALGLDAWDDPHNTDPRFQRVRLRTEVLPLLEDVLQGGVAEALARTATMLQADLDALDEAAQAASVHLTTGDELVITEVEGLVPAIRARVLREWLHRRGVPPGQLRAAHLAAVDALATSWRGQGPIPLPGGLEAGRDSGRLWARVSRRAG